MEMVDSGNGAFRKCHNNVATQYSGAGGGASGQYLFHADSALHAEIVEPHQPPRQCYILPDHADVAPADESIFDQPGGNKLRGVDSRGETDTLCAANHRCVDADDFAAGSYQWATGVAGVKSGI